MKRVFAWCNLLLMALLLTACGGGDGGDDDSSAPKEVTIVSLQVTPAQASIPHGLQQRFRVQAVMSDESIQDMTAHPTLSWRSDDTAIATVTSDGLNGSGFGSGLVVGVKPGYANIIASVIVKGVTYSGSAEVTVSDAVVTFLQLSPPTASVAVGLEQRFTAMALLSDGRSWDLTDDPVLVWRSNDTAIATISNEPGRKGMVTGVKAGRVTITASGTAGGVSFSAMTELIVTDAVVTGLRLNPAKMSVPAGLGLSFTAEALSSDGRSQNVTEHVTLSWSSSDPAIATVSNEPGSKGRVTGKKPGNVIITTTANVNGSVLEATAELTVTEAVVTALQVAPSSKSIAQGLSAQFAATVLMSDGHSQDVTEHPELSWISSNPGIADVSSMAGSKGLVRGVHVGRVSITAVGKVNETVLRAVSEVTVTDAVVTDLQLSSESDSVPVGLTMQFSATGVLSDGRPLDMTKHAELSWSSSDPSIASISNAADSKGLATGVSKGEVTITASGSINGAPFSETLPLKVTDAVVTGLKVESKGNSVPAGLDLELTAKALLSDGSWIDVTNTPAVTWSSSDQSIVTVSADGQKVRAKGIAKGRATITASGEANGKTFKATLEITVTDAIVTGMQVTPEKMFLPLGAQGSFTAMALLSDGNKTNMTNDASLNWTVGDSTIVNMSGAGVVSGLRIGETTVTASITVNGTPFSGSAELTVVDAVVTSLEIMTTGNLVEKFDKQFIAEATFSDGTRRDMTAHPDLSWSSGNTSVATVSNEAGKKGLVHGVAAGSTKITAAGTFHDEWFSDDGDLTVTLCDTKGTGAYTVTTNGQIFVRPQIKCEADGFGMKYSGTYTEKNKPYVKITGRDAASACASMGQGYRLPTEDELSALYLDQGNMSVSHGWPIKNVYWSSTTSNYANTYYAVDLATGRVDFRDDGFAYYVTCVRPSTF